LNELKDRVVAAQLNAVARARWRTAPLVLAVHPRSGPAPHVRRQALVYWQKDRQWASHRDGETAASSSLRLRHEALLYTADVVTGVSAQIVEDNARLGVTAHLIPNGVEVAHWTRAAEEPPDLAVIPGPRVLFSGSWGWRVDQPTVVEMALMRPQYAFVVVGEGAPPATAPSNLHFLGKKSYSALPGYLQHSSVGVIPYLDNEFNAASSPLKMWEYVASGLPVIGSGVPFPSGLSGVRTVAGVSAWLQALDEEVLAAGQAGRRSPDLEILEEVSWEARAARLLELADDVVRCR
jgi:glycosyltransferase involved in cell wall biosynthesis